MRYAFNENCNMQSIALYVLLLWLTPLKSCWAQTIQSTNLPLVERSNNLLEGALLTLLFFALAGAMPLCSFLGLATDKRYYAVSFVSLCAGVYALSSTGLVPSIIDSPIIWQFPAMISLYFLPVGICTFIVKSFPKESKMLFLHYLGRAYTPFALVALVAVAANFTSLMTTMIIFFLLLIITLAALILVLQKSARAGKAHAESIIIGVIFLLVSGLISNVNKTLGTVIPLELFPLWGLLGFIGCLIMALKTSRKQSPVATAGASVKPDRIQQDQPTMWGDQQALHSRNSKCTNINSPERSTNCDLHVPTSDKGQFGIPSLKTSVSSFTHELNTPLGTSILAATHLAKEIEELHDLFRDGDLRKSDLEKHLLSYKESANIITANLQSASDIVRHYKNEITAEAPLTRQTFNVLKHIKQVLADLKPRITEAGHEIHITGSDDITIYSYPSMFTQIISNLIINSLTHAYLPTEKGNLSLKIILDGSILEITYSDDGKGIDKHIIEKIFDPHFTTNLQSGNTGLGLSVVHDLVTRHLNGHIQCHSVPCKCAIFLIRIPIERR